MDTKRAKLEAHDAAGYETDYMDFAAHGDGYGNQVMMGDLSVQRLVETGIREGRDAEAAGYDEKDVLSFLGKPAELLDKPVKALVSPVRGAMKGISRYQRTDAGQNISKGLIIGAALGAGGAAAAPYLGAGGAGGGTGAIATAPEAATAISPTVAPAAASTPAATGGASASLSTVDKFRIAQAGLSGLGQSGGAQGPEPQAAPAAAPTRPPSYGVASSRVGRGGLGVGVGNPFEGAYDPDILV